MVISDCSREAKPRTEGEKVVVVPPPPPPPTDLDPLQPNSSASTNHKPFSSADMSRESRHVRVDGLPLGLPQDQLRDFFSGFGRVQKVLKIVVGGEEADKEAVVVSFMDVRSAQKAVQASEPKLEGSQLRIQFHEPTSTSKNSAASPTLASGGNLGRTTPSDLLTEESPKRISGSSRPSSALSYEDSGERKQYTGVTEQQEPTASTKQLTNSSAKSSPCRSSSSPSPSTQPHHHQKRSVRRKGTVAETSAETAKDEKSSSGHPMSSSAEGLQGIYVHHLPPNSQEQLSTVVRRHAKLIHIVYEQGAEGKSALILLQNVANMEALLTTLNLTQLAGAQLKAAVANHVTVTEAYNSHLSATSAAVAGLAKKALCLPPPPAIPGLFGDIPPAKSTSSSLFADKKKVISLKTCNINSSTSSALLAGVRSSAPCSSATASTTAPSISSIASYGGMSSSSVTNDPLSKNASRTLYVGNLEKRVTDQCLKTRYGIYGHILEVELKSKDTAAPFAFIQFTNIKSVAAAIGASHPANKSATAATGEVQKPVKVGWGKSICSNKLWIGALPKSCSKEYLLSKMRVITPEDVTEVMYDSRHNETLILFKTNDAAQIAYSKIKNRVFMLSVQVDYCSEKLHDFFVDRQFGRFGGILPAEGLEEATGSAEGHIRLKESDLLMVAQKKAMTTGGIPDTLLLAPPPDPPKNLATDLVARSNEHLGVSTANSQQSLGAGIVPPDPAMTTSNNSTEKSLIHRHNSSSHRRQPVSSSPDPSSSRVQRHETPSSRHREGNERERSSDYTSSSRTAERDRRSTSHSYQSKRKGEEHRYESSSRHGQLSTSDRNRSSHSSHYSQPTGSSSHYNSSSIATSCSQQLHPEYTPSYSIKRTAVRRPDHQSSLSSSSTSSSGSSDSTSDSSQSSSEAGRLRPSATRHSWEHRSRKKEKGVERTSTKRTEAKVNSVESNTVTPSSRHQPSKSLQKPSCGNNNSSRNSSGRDKGFESARSAASQSTSKERAEILPPANCHGFKSRKSGLSTGSNEKNRHSSSPLCPPPPMPSISIVLNPSSSSKLKKLDRSEKVRDSSSSSSASTSSFMSDSQKQPQSRRNRTEIKESSSVNIKKLPSVIESSKAAPSLVLSSTTQNTDKLLSSTNFRSETIYQEPFNASISTSTPHPEEKHPSSAALAKTMISCATTGPPLSAPLPTTAVEWVAGRRISHSISSGSSAQPSIKHPPKQLLKTPLNIPYSLKTACEVKDPRTGRLQRHFPSSQMSLPLPRFVEISSFRWNKEKRSPANSVSGSVIGLDVVQRSPPMSAVVQKSSFSGKFFPGNQQEEKETDAPQDPRGKESTASLCSPAKSMDLEGNARSILGFSPEPEKPAKAKELDPLAELFKNVAPAAPSSLAKRLTEFRNKYKDVEQKIQETKMNVFAASSSRKPTSIEQELERLQSRSQTLSGISHDNSQESIDLPKRSLSIHIPASSNINNISHNKPSSPSTTLHNLKKVFNLNILEHDQYSTPNSQSSPILNKSEDGDQPVVYQAPTYQPRQSPQMTTSSCSFRPSSSPVSMPNSVTSKSECKSISSLARQGGRPIAPAIPTIRPLHISMPGSETDGGMASPSGTPINVMKSISSTNSTPGSMRTPVSAAVGPSFATGDHPLSMSKHSASVHMPPPKDSNRNNRILDDLFRQQANNTKRVVVNKVEKKSTTSGAGLSGELHQTNSSAVKEVAKKSSIAMNTSSCGAGEKDKSSEKYLMKLKRREERKKEEEMRERHQKHQKEKKEFGSGSSLQKHKDKMKEEKPKSESKSSTEKKEHENKSSLYKHDKLHNKEKEEQKKAAKQIAKAGRRRKEEQEEKERQKERKRKKLVQTAPSSESEDEEEDSDAGSNISLTDFGLAGVDIEEQRRMMKQIKAGNFGMSMYDRVKRRSSAQRPENQKKKSKALQILREKTSKKKKFNRIQLSSSDEDNENSGDEGKRRREKRSNEEEEESDNSKAESKFNSKRDKDGHHQRSDFESDDGRASITSQSTTATALNFNTPSSSNATKKCVEAVEKDELKAKSVTAMEKDEPKQKSVILADKEESKSKAVETSLILKKQPTSVPQVSIPEVKVFKKVKSKEEVPTKEKSVPLFSVSTNKERKEKNDKSKENSKKSVVPARRSSSSSSDSSGGSTSDGSDASSTDGDAYIKKLQKELSKCRSSSPANTPAGSDSEVKPKATKTKPTKSTFSSKETNNNSKTSKITSKKQSQTKKVERLSMEDVYGQESSDDAEGVHNSTSSTANSGAKKESPAEHLKDKTSALNTKLKSKQSMAELFGVSDKPVKKTVPKKVTELSSRKSTMEPIEAMFIKQDTKKTSVEETTKGKPAKVDETGPKKKEKSQTPASETESVKRKKKSSESTHTSSQPTCELKKRKVEAQEEEKKNISKKRQACENEPSAADTTAKRVKTEAAEVPETKSSSKEVDPETCKPMASPTGRKAPLKEIKQEPLTVAPDQKPAVPIQPSQELKKSTTPPAVLTNETDLQPIKKEEIVQQTTPLPTKNPIELLSTTAVSSSSSSCSSSSSSSSSDSDDSSAEEQGSPLKSKCQKSGNSSSSLAQIQSHHRHQFHRTGLNAPTKPQPPIVTYRQDASPQSKASQLTSPQLNSPQLTVSAKAQNSPQLTSPTSSRPDRLSSIGPSTSLEDIAAEDVQKLAAELAAGVATSSTNFEVLEHGTVVAAAVNLVETRPNILALPTLAPKASSKPTEPSKPTTPARRGRAPAAKKPTKNQPKFGIVSVLPPKAEEKSNKGQDFDSDEMEAELLRRICEEEDMAVMNLTTGDGDDAFGGKHPLAVVVKQETAEAAKPVLPVLSPAQKDVKKDDIKVSGKGAAAKSTPASVKISSPLPPQSTLALSKKTDKTIQVEPVERRSSNESMESSHMGSGGGYMEIDAEHLLQQQKEQEELEKKQEQERRKAEEFARMEETVEAVIAAASRSSQQSQPPAPTAPVAGSDTTSPYQTVQLQSSIDSRTPQSESSGHGAATPRPLVSYAPTVIASQGSQHGSPVVVVQVQQPYSTQIYGTPQHKGGVIVEEKGGKPGFSNMVQSPAGGPGSVGHSVVVSASSSLHISQMIQQQQKLMHQQNPEHRQPVVQQQPVAASPAAGKRQKQHVARAQTVLAPTSQQGQKDQAIPQQQNILQQHMGVVHGQQPTAAGGGTEFGGVEQQNVNARLLAFYNQLNFMNPMATAQGQQQTQQQQQAPNAAPTPTTTASTPANRPAQLTNRHWPSMVSPTVTQPSKNSLVNGDPASLELFRQQHAAQMQALQTQPNNIGSNQPTTATGQDLLLQQHFQAQQHRQISAQQQQTQQQPLNYAPVARNTQPVQMLQQQQNRQEVVGQIDGKPSPAYLNQQQNAAYMAQQLQLQQQQQVYPHLQPAQQQIVMQHNQADQQQQQQQRNTNEKYPVLWQGQLAMKNTDTLVQMHRVCGNDKLIDITNQELVSRANGISTIRITQRMRLEHTQLESLMKKMEKDANYVALVCLPCGRNREDITVQTSRMTTHFIDYFTSKMAAGIVNQGPTIPTPSCVAHVFPPGEFATGHLNRHAPDLLVTIEKHNAGYLFVVITTNN